METRRITVLSAGLGVPSSSRLLADQLAASTERQLAAAGYAVTVDVVELRDLAVDIANNFVTGYAGSAAGGSDRRRRRLGRHHCGQPRVQCLLQRSVQIVHRCPGPQVPGRQGRAARGHGRHGPAPDGAGLRHAAPVHLPAHPYRGYRSLRRPPGLGTTTTAAARRSRCGSTGLRASLPDLCRTPARSRKQPALESLPFEQLLAGISGGR